MAASSTTAVDLSAAMVTQPVPAADWLIVAPLLTCMIVGTLCVMDRKNTRRQAGIAIGGLLLAFAFSVGLFIRVWDGGTVVMTMGRWLPPFGITFTSDLFGALFSLTASIVALAGGIFAIRDIDVTGRRYGFYPFLLLMMTGVHGAFATGDIFNLYVWFEVLLISSFGLIILGSEARQLDGATKYAILNLIATTLFLVATGLLYGVFGTLNMADIARKADDLRPAAPMTTLAGLFFLAFAMKAAAFPLNFWLPASYHTPRIVVAAVFAGLLTKVGVYALLRTMVLLLDTERAAMANIIGWVAIATMLSGAIGALAQNDIRRLLGFVVISGIGVMIAGLAIGSGPGISGAIFYAVHSMIVMTAMYLAAGIAGSRMGTFALTSSGGLYARVPLLSVVILVLALSVSGLPPFSGLWPKAFLVKASLDAGAIGVAAAILVSGFILTIATVRVFVLACWRERPTDGDGASGHIPQASLAPLLALTALSVAVGVYPQPLLTIADAAAAGLLDPASYVGTVFPAGATP